MENNRDKNSDANLKPFVKGESGNPNGRPKGQKNYATLYKEGLQRLAELNDKEPDEIEMEMMSNAVKLARKGDYRFYKDLMDRKYGMAIQRRENLNMNADLELLPDEEKERLSKLLDGEGKGD